MCFTVQLSKIGFALPFVLNSFAIISCRFLPVKNFFSTFLKLFYFSLAATLISYHIQPAVVKNFFISFYSSLSDATRLCYHESFQMSRTFFISFHQRRRRDLNPRTAQTVYTLSRGTSSAT